jgi:hypothetical protein
MTVMSSSPSDPAAAVLPAGPALILAGDADLTWEPLAAWVGPQLRVPPGWPSPQLDAWLSSGDTPGSDRPAPAGPPPAGGIAAPGGDHSARLGQALQALPGGRLVYFVAGPEHRLLASAGQPIREVLDAWASSARALLRLAHNCPGRCLFVDIQDAWAHPDELADTLADWLECPRQPATGAAPSPVFKTDAAGWLLARAALAAHPAVADIAAELHDSAVPLGPTGTDGFVGASSPDASSALAAWQASRLADAALQLQHAEALRDRERLDEAQRGLSAELASATQRLEARQAEVQSLQAEKLQLESDRQALGQALDQSLHSHQQDQAALAAAAQRVSDADDELRLLGLQVAHALQDNDQIAIEREREAQAAAAWRAQTDADLAQLQREHSELQHQLHDASRTHSALESLLAAAEQDQAAWRASRAEHEQMKAQLATRQAERDALAEALAAAQGELQALQTLRQEREELIAQLYTARTDASAAQALAWAAAPDPTQAERRLPLTLGGLNLVHARDELPHREVQFRLLEVLSPHGELPQLDLRLVEHHGRPGLVIFESGAGFEAVSNWHRTGEEGGRGYMLLVPADELSRRHLAHMAAADWQFMGELAAFLSMAVTEPDFELAPHWRHIAARLERQLAQLTPRLRYDQLTATPGATAAEAWQVRFGACSFGTQRLPAIELVWRPTGPHDTTPQGCALAWALPSDPDEPPPLAHWPAQADGRLQPLLPIPVGPGWGAAARRRWWSGLAAADRELVLSVLDALPAAADAAGQPAQRPAAHALHRDARRTLSSQAVRRVVRKLLRRPAAVA